MKRLRDIIEHFATDKVYNNPTPQQLKGIARNSPFGQARFVIRKSGGVVAGDATNLLHTDLEPDEKEHHIAGFVVHNRKAQQANKFYPEKDEFYYHDYPRMSSHPYIDRMKKAGMQHFFLSKASKAKETA